jgi:hypothetical protein
MTIEEQVEDALSLWDYLVAFSDADESYNWFNSIPIIIDGLNNEGIKKAMLKWIPEAYMNDHTSGFIIQNKAVFDKWYETLKLNTKNDTTTTNSIT